MKTEFSERIRTHAYARTDRITATVDYYKVEAVRHEQGRACPQNRLQQEYGLYTAAAPFPQSFDGYDDQGSGSA